MATAKRKVINANIILYGPSRTGKTSNIQFIHRKLKPSQRGQIVSMNQESFPRVAYEFLPIELGELKGYDTNLYIYTSPAHDDGLETRLNLLNEAAGVVFIADSSPDRMDDNIESLTNLKEELRYWGIDFDTFPVVFQYNKRDLSNALSREEMEAQLNPEGKESFEAIASVGQGVRDTFALISKMAVRRVRTRLAGDSGEDGDEAPRNEDTVKRRLPSGAAPTPLTTAPPVRPQPQTLSEVTLEEAPPQRPEELAAPGNRRKAETQPARLHVRDESQEVVSRDDEPTQHGVKLGKSQASSTPAAAPAAPVAETNAEDDAQAQDKGRKRKSDKGKKKGDAASEAAPVPAPVAPVVPEPEPEPEAPAPTRRSSEFASNVSLDGTSSDVASADDFFKTSLTFGDMGAEMMDVGAVEAGEFEADEAFDDEESQAADLFSGFHDVGSESLGTVSLPESAAIASLSLDAGLGDMDINIRTYADDDEDDDDDAPVIRLGSRREAEELQLEEDMLLDDLSPDELGGAEDAGKDLEPIGELGLTELEPIAEQSLSEIEPVGVKTREIPVPEPVSARELASEKTLDLPPSMVDTTERPIPGSVADRETGEASELDQAEQEGAAGGVTDWSATANVPSFLAIPLIDSSAQDAAEQDNTAPIEEDERITYGDLEKEAETAAPSPWDLTSDRVEIISPADTGTGSAQTELGALNQDALDNEESVIDLSVRTSAALLTEDFASSQVIDIRGLGEPEHLTDLALSPLDEESTAAQEVHEDPVFESIVEPPSAFDSGVMLEMPFDDAASAAPVKDAAPDVSNGLALTSWGETQRVDDTTVLVPVRVRLPNSTQEVELSVKLSVDVLLADLLAAARIR